MSNNTQRKVIIMGLHRARGKKEVNHHARHCHVRSRGRSYNHFPLEAKFVKIAHHETVDKERPRFCSNGSGVRVKSIT